MKNFTKKFIAMLLIAILGVSSAIAPVFAGTMADGTYVEGVSDDELYSINNLCVNQLLATAFSCYVYEVMEPGTKATFDFSKESKRRYVLKYLDDQGFYNEIGGAKSANDVSKRLFGISTPNIRTISGEEGDSIPYIGYGERVWNYKFIGKNKLKLTFGIYLVDEIYDTGVSCDAEVTYTLKRKPSAKYGWIIKSAIIRKD